MELFTETKKELVKKTEKMGILMDEYGIFIDSINRSSSSNIREDKEQILRVIEKWNNKSILIESNINKCIEEFEVLKQLVYSCSNLLDNLRIEVNRATIGTLEGLSRQTIAKHGMTTNNEKIQEVLDQLYNERRGGKSKKRRKL